MRFARGLFKGYESKRGSKDGSKDFDVSTWVNGGALYWDREPWVGGRLASREKTPEFGFEHVKSDTHIRHPREGTIGIGYLVLDVWEALGAKLNTWESLIYRWNWVTSLRKEG